MVKVSINVITCLIGVGDDIVAYFIGDCKGRKVDFLWGVVGNDNSRGVLMKPLG